MRALSFISLLADAALHCALVAHRRTRKNCQAAADISRFPEGARIRGDTVSRCADAQGRRCNFSQFRSLTVRAVNAFRSAPRAVICAVFTGVELIVIACALFPLRTDEARRRRGRSSRGCVRIKIAAVCSRTITRHRVADRARPRTLRSIRRVGFSRRENTSELIVARRAIRPAFSIIFARYPEIIRGSV